MKTTNRQNRAAKLTATACAIVLLGTSAWSQQADEAYQRVKEAANALQEQVKYQAPSVEAADYAAAYNRLATVAENTQKQVAYHAPSVEEADYTNAVTRLAAVNERVKKEIAYKAPEAEMYYDYKNAEEGTASEFLASNADEK